MRNFFHPKPLYSTPKDDPRFDADLTKAARDEGLTEDEIAALLQQCHSENPDDALDAYRDLNSRRWKVCPAVIPHWSKRPPNYVPQMWLPEWAALHREGKPF